LFFAEDAILVTATNYDADAKGGPSTMGRGLSLDKSYTGYRWASNEKENGWEYQIPNFNILEGDCDFRITWQGETCTLKLHPVEMWSYLKRDYLPGRTGSPKMFLVTLEIPENAFEKLSDNFVRHLTEKFAKYDRTIFHYTIAATDNYIIMRDTGNTGPLLFLTDGTVSAQYSELHTGLHVTHYGEVRRYYSPELTVNKNTVVTAEELNEKITLNRRFVDELKYKIRVLKWSQLTAFKINVGYLPVHYITKITPLRFIDVPKIRTMTSFGEKLVLANSAYTYTVTGTRIRLYEKIIELLETRILCYNDTAKELSRFSADTIATDGIGIPPWYSDNISDYWDIAGLPRTIPGTFTRPGTGNQPVRIPAVLSFVPSPSGQGVSGWFFAAGESSDFTVFIESRNGAKTIYSRRGKTPQEKRLRLDCTLYINDNATSPIERDIIERCLRPYITGIDEGINIRIIFDGKTFEIREHPAKRNEPLIFQGNL
jgi:hypothetical protein